MAKVQNTGNPTFTGRNVPISELAKAMGKSSAFLARGLREGVFRFGYALKSDNGEKYSYLCPDKKVWEDTGYFNPNPEQSLGEDN